MGINLLPFICESFSTNSKIYRDIDNVYQKNKIEFYNLAKKNKFYSHHIAKEGSLLQEEYFKKALGIFIQLQLDGSYEEEVFNIIKKGWPYAFNYVKNHNTIILEDFMISFMKKHKGLDNITDDYINSNVIMLLLLSQYFESNIEETGLLQKHIQMLLYRMEHYKGEGRVNYNKISKDNLKLIREIILKLKNIGISKYISMSIKDKNLDRYLNTLELVFDFENISLVSIVDEIKLTDKELEEIVFLYLLYRNNVKHIDEINIEEVAKYVIDMLHIRYFAKAYKEVKKHYFKNNKETMFVELESVESELRKVKKEKILLQDEKEKLLSKLNNKDREIARLKAKLAESESSKKELIKLREFMFSLDKQEEYKEDTNLDISKLKNIKGVIIGGHQNWQNKLKEYLPSFKFISPEMLNFDTSILNNADIVFFYTNYLNHGIYYKVINEIRNKDIKLEYLKSNVNGNIVLQQILKAVDSI